MRKRYTKIYGNKVAYKGDLSQSTIRWSVFRMIEKGVISDALPNGGWWIKAK